MIYNIVFHKILKKIINYFIFICNMKIMLIVIIYLFEKSYNNETKILDGVQTILLLHSIIKGHAQFRFPYPHAGSRSAARHQTDPREIEPCKFVKRVALDFYFVYVHFDILFLN